LIAFAAALLTGFLGKLNQMQRGRERLGAVADYDFEEEYGYENEEEAEETLVSTQR
jgi:hypothetical protein